MFAYIAIYIYIYIYMCESWWVWFYLSLPGMNVGLYLPMLELSALTPPLLAIFWELVLWACSYEPWDRFMFSANSGILHCFYRSDFICLRKHRFPLVLPICKDPACTSWEHCFFEILMWERLSFFEIPILLIDWVHLNGSGWIYVDFMDSRGGRFVNLWQP